jgi:hypothetical protein
MSLTEVIQWQAQYAISEGSQIVYNRHMQAEVDKAEQAKILNG